MDNAPDTPIRLSCSTGTLYHLPLATAMGIIRDAGFDGVEIVASPEILMRGPQFIRRVAHQTRLPVLSYHPPLFPLFGWPKGQIERILAVMHGAYDTGATVGVIHAPKLYTMQTLRGQAYVQGVQLARRFQDYYGVQLSLETTQKPWKHHIYPRLFDDMEYFMRFAKHNDLTITLDTSHSGANGDDIATVLQHIGNRLNNIHISDCRIEMQHNKPATHLFPGEGNAVDFDALFSTLRHQRFQGLITLEISPVAAGILPINTLLRRLSEARIFLARLLNTMQQNELLTNMP